jgi:hypothetical protein
MERRPFLMAGGASVLALAADLPSTAGDAVSEGPADVVEEYYRRASTAETARAFARRVPELAHGASPLPDVIEDVPGAFASTLEQDLVDAAVVERDLDGEQIRAVSEFFASSLSDADLDRIAGDNAVVAVTLDTDEVIGGTLAKEWLVAPEDGTWRLVWFQGRNSPRATAREFFREVTTAGSFEALDEPIEELSHELSPLVNAAEYTPWLFAGLRRQTLVRTEVAATDIGKREIASGFAPVASWTTRDGIETIAEENAVVAVTVRDGQLALDEVVREWLVAPDAGEWRLVWI